MLLASRGWVAGVVGLVTACAVADVAESRVLQLRGRAGCVAFHASCVQPPGLREWRHTTWTFSADQRSLYGANERTIAALRRSSQSGRLRPVAGLGACLSAARIHGCRRAPALRAAAPDSTWTLWMGANG